MTNHTYVAVDAVRVGSFFGVASCRKRPPLHMGAFPLRSRGNS